MYSYKLKSIDRVIDADTIEATVDLGFNVSMKMTIRFFGIDAPETRGPEREAGLLAKNFLQNKIRDIERVEKFDYWIFDSYKDERGSFGRYLGVIKPMFTPPDGEGLDLNKELLYSGHAEVMED